MINNKKYALNLKNLEFSYTADPFLKNINLEIHPGEIVSLIGPNGSGKSTVIKLAAGLETPAGGKVSLGGTNLKDWKKKTLARELAYLPQNPLLPGSFTVEESVLLGRTPYLPFLGIPDARDKEVCDYMIKRVDAEHLINRYIGDLSGGERQRVLLARALAQEPGLLLLDEPTSFLDVHHQASILSLIHALSREQEIGVLMVLHDLNLAATFSDSLVLLVQGEIRAQGTPGAVLRSEILEKIYGSQITIFPHPEDHSRPAVLPLKGRSG